MHKWTQKELLDRTVRSGSCLLWQGSCGNMGYGTIRHDGKYTTTHRLSWQLANGAIPPGMFVMHSCDVKLCINPDHLSIGTNADNLKDMINKGKSPCGEQKPNSKLTDIDVIEMRSLYPYCGIGLERLGRQYGVSFSVARRIIRKETWRHV